MPDLTNSRIEFERQVTTAEGIVGNVEALWQLAPNGSDVRRQIGDAELAALYEMAFLTIFGHWENFIENCLVRMLAGQGTASYTVALINPPRAASLRAARSALLNGRDYMLWHNPATCIQRISSAVTGSPLETTLVARQQQIEFYAAIRHGIAHRSVDALDKYLTAATALCGVAHSRPGDLLRAQCHDDPLNPVRWIRKISSELRQLALAATS